MNVKKVLSIVSVVVSGLCAIACTCGGSPGNNDRLIFGSAVDYEGVDAMNASVAAGSKLILAVETSHGATQSENAAVLTGMQLRIESTSAGAAGMTLTTTPVGPGRWSVDVPTEGSYRLTAVNSSGSAVDTFDLRAAAAEAVTFDDDVTVVTRGRRADGTACELRSTRNLRGLSLRANQEVEIVTVATAGGVRLAGILDLDLAGTAGATVRAVPAGRQVVANVVAVAPTAAPGEGIELDVLDRSTGLHATARIGTTAGDAAVTCPAL